MEEGGGRREEGWGERVGVVYLLCHWATMPHSRLFLHRGSFVLHWQALARLFFSFGTTLQRLHGNNNNTQHATHNTHNTQHTTHTTLTCCSISRLIDHLVTRPLFCSSLDFFFFSFAGRLRFPPARNAKPSVGENARSMFIFALPTNRAKHL